MKREPALLVALPIEGRPCVVAVGDGDDVAARLVDWITHAPCNDGVANALAALFSAIDRLDE